MHEEHLSAIFLGFIIIFCVLPTHVLWNARLHLASQAFKSEVSKLFDDTDLTGKHARIDVQVGSQVCSCMLSIEKVEAVALLLLVDGKTAEPR